MTKPKKGGLGMNALFEQVMTPPAVQPNSERQGNAEQDGAQPTSRIKIRNTFVIYEDTMKTLEILRLLAERKKAGSKATKVTYGDLIEEAVQALIEKKSKEGDFQKKLKEMLEMSW